MRFPDGACIEGPCEISISCGPPEDFGPKEKNFFNTAGGQFKKRKAHSDGSKSDNPAMPAIWAGKVEILAGASDAPFGGKSENAVNQTAARSSGRNVLSNFHGQKLHFAGAFGAESSINE